MATRVQSGPGVRVFTHGADRQEIRDTEINSQAHSAGREIIAVGVFFGVDADKVAKPCQPHPPAVLRTGLQDWFNDTRRGFPVQTGFPVVLGLGPVHLDVGTKAT